MVSVYDKSSDELKQHSKKHQVTKKSKSSAMPLHSTDDKTVKGKSRKIKVEPEPMSLEQPMTKRRRKLSSDDSVVLEQEASSLPVMENEVAPRGKGPKGRRKANPPDTEQPPATYDAGAATQNSVDLVDLPHPDSNKDGDSEGTLVKMPRGKQPSTKMPLTQRRRKHLEPVREESERASASQEVELVTPSLEADTSTENQPAISEGWNTKEAFISQENAAAVDLDHSETQKVPEIQNQAGQCAGTSVSLPTIHSSKTSKYPMTAPSAPLETKVTLSRPVNPFSLQGDFFSVTFSPRLSGYIYDDYFHPTDNILYDAAYPVSVFLEQNKTVLGNKLETLFNTYFESHLVTSKEKSSRSFKVKVAKMKSKNYSECFPLIHFVRFLICMTRIDIEDAKARFDKSEIRKFQESLSTLCEAIERRVHYHENKMG